MKDVEALTSGVTVIDTGDVDRYKDAFARLRRHALVDSAMRRLLRRVASDLRDEKARPTEGPSE